jgi:PAS domain S-box-containing protein
MTTQHPEQAAQDSALAAIVRSSQDAVIAKSVDGIITAWNPGATLVYGWAPEQVLGHHIDTLVPPASLQAERARHARVARGHAESGYRCWRLHADGRAVEVVMSMSPVRDGAGTVVGLASISRPVSDRERSDTRFASLLEAAPDAMVCVDAHGTVALVNAQASAVFGYSRAELVGAPVDMLVDEQARPRHRDHRQRFFGQPTPRAMGAGLALRARRRDGSTFPVEISLGTDGDGPHALAIAAIRDVSDQRRMEAELRESELRLRQLAEHVDTVFTLRQIEPFAYLYVSPSFTTLTGLDVADIHAHPDLVADLVHPEDRERVQTDYLDVVNSGRPAHSEHRIVRADGQIRWIRAFATQVHDMVGPPNRIVTTTQDITEQVETARALQRAEEAARLANDSKNEFLSRMSHELRTPLNAVIGFGQLLEMHLAGTDQVDAARHVVRAGRHLLELINEVLDITRIEAGQMSVSLEPVSVPAIVGESGRLMAPLADAAGIALALDGGPADDYVVADHQRLRQILLNLISNGIKYTPRGGHVWVGWHAHNGTTDITIRDDGPGIAPELAPRVFAPFDRLGAEASGVEGTGVGLTVTRRLAELLGGAVSFTSAPGHGATFTVTLPTSHEPALAGTAAPVGASARAAPTAAAPGSATLLYIEDNEPNVRVMSSIVSLRPAWRMVHAGLARLGIELALAHRPELILLDLHLPDGTGLEVVRALKSGAAPLPARVVVLTADASTAQEHRVRAAGADGYLTKPLEVAEVLALLDEVAAAMPERGAS